jgi:malate dehydrogenase
MPSVSIVGAGEIGASVARALAVRERFTRLRLIDAEGSVAEGKALDIRQAGPIEGYDTRITGDRDLSSAVGVDVVVIADRAAGGEWAADAGLMMVRRLVELGVTAPFVFAGGSARDLIETIAVETAIDRARLIGSAPEALAAAVKAFVALEANGSPADVRLAIVGVPPKQVVVPWGDASIGGYSATRVLDPSAVARIDRRLPALWPPGPYTLAIAAARLVEAIGGARRIFSAFAVVDARGSTAAVPVSLGPRGIERLVIPTLDARERVVFENSVSR